MQIQRIQNNYNSYKPKFNGSFYVKNYRNDSMIYTKTIPLQDELLITLLKNRLISDFKKADRYYGVDIYINSITKNDLLKYIEEVSEATSKTFSLPKLSDDCSAKVCCKRFPVDDDPREGGIPPARKWVTLEVADDNKFEVVHKFDEYELDIGDFSSFILKR